MGARLWLLVLALVQSIASSAWALPAETWLVAIGNNLGAAADPPLRFAERDAKAFAEVLRRTGGVASDRVTLVLDAEADTARRALSTLNAQLRARGGERPTALVVYYSGHADADALHLGQTRLPFDELRDLVGGSAASVRLLVVDACRSGGVSRVKGGAAAPSFPVTRPDEIVTEGFAVLTSSAAGEASQESDRLGGSFFSHHLMNGMRGAADRDNDRLVTLSEAYEYAYNQTLRASGQTLNRQHPTYAFDVKGRGGLVLSRLDRTDRRAGTLTLADAAIYVISRDRRGGPLLAEVSPPRDGASLLVPAGRYFVQQRMSDQFREFTVEVQGEAAADLRQTPYRVVEYDRLVRSRGASPRSVHGLTALGGARTEVIDGEGITPQATLGYRIDLPWLSVSLRGRVSSRSTYPEGGLSSRRRDEFGAGIAVERFVDFNHFSLGLGLLLEGAWYQQVFDTDRDTPDRTGYTATFGGLLALERALGGGLGLRIEAGPQTILYRALTAVDGAPSAEETASSFVGWAAAGLTWRL